MRKLTRREHAAMGALEHALEHEPALRPVLVEDYTRATGDVHRLHDRRERWIAALAGHIDEHGSRSAIMPGHGLVRYGEEDPTGFAPGAVC